MMIRRNEEGDDHRHSSRNNRQEVQHTTARSRSQYPSPSRINMDRLSMPTNNNRLESYGKILDFLL
jgi:hypothetical protein